MGAVDEASSREDSNTSNHNLRDLHSTGPSPDWHAAPLQTLLLRVGTASHGTHSCTLFAAAVVCFYLVINGNTELERIVRTLTDINYGHYREQAGREEKRPVGLPASLQLLPDNCNHLTQPGAGPLKG